MKRLKLSKMKINYNNLTTLKKEATPKDCYTASHRNSKLHTYTHVNLIKIGCQTI